MVATKPNVLFFLIDDLGWRDLACFGSSFYETPNLDRLARQGLKFDQAYASCPVCSPTRASVMSGKYPARVGITQFIGGKGEAKLKFVPYLHYLPQEETSVATAMREGGYQTWHVGKWHLGDEPFYPQHHGFDVNIGGCHWGMPQKGFFSPWQIPGLPDPPEKGVYLTDYLTDRAIELIRNRDAAKPFFLDFWHYAVHIPIEAPEPLVAKYRAKAKALNLDSVNPFVEGDYYPATHIQNHRMKTRILQSDPAYAAMIENLDTNIGRVLDALEAEGIADETLVVFTSDNGGVATSEGSPTCNLPLARAKGWNEEGGTRVCQIIRWPGVTTADSVCHTPVTSTDFYPTFLEAAGLPARPEQHCDGVSLLPLLRGESTLDREALYWHYPHYSNQGGRPAASMVSGCGRWKLIERFEDGTLELYDLVADIGETRDLAAAHPDRVATMHAALQAWQRDVEAKIPEPNPDYVPPVRPAIPNNAEV